ncbi:MAG: DUF1080 domain-containing protein [Muribaculum sp.]|nr:DUF1080 domain-containing protein [Muribaculaceae bacterium]MCM1080121.1 DUF1080 domain-containing protein [Muribaculum sp.]
MKKILFIIAIALLTGISAFAQRDSRNRLPETVVADALARMPVQKHTDFNETMADLAAIPQISVKTIAGYLQPHGKAESNAKYEYALSGLVDYCVARGDTALASTLNKELTAAAAAQIDSENRLFLQKLAARTEFAKTADETPVNTVVYKTHDKNLCKNAFKTLQKGNAQQRNAALDQTVIEGCQNEIVAVIGKSKILPVDAQADVLRWIGDNHIELGLPLVTNPKNLLDPATAEASIEAAAKFTADNALSYLESALNTDYAPQAAIALRSYRGDIAQMSQRVMSTGDTRAKDNIVVMAEKRRVPALFKAIDTYLPNATDSKSAYKALANCASGSDFNTLCAMLDADNGQNLTYLSTGITNAMGGADGSRQFEMLQPIVEKAAKPANFYPLLAKSNSGRAMNMLNDAFAKGNDKDAAFEALLIVDRKEMPELLYKIALSDSARRDKAAQRISKLVDKSDAEPAAKSFQLRRLLPMNLSDKTRNLVITSLGKTATGSALSGVAPWLDNKATERAAAGAVKNIVSKNKSLQGHESTNNLLTKAMAIYAAQTNNADAGYAVDEIKLLMQQKAPAAAKLSDEEEQQGFELLFDGLTLDGWHGNTVNYTPEDGCIYVSAGYGSEGNLYTDKDYSDFVFRFEFQFLEPGVNNGVGIRTTAEGMDAAYHGMEIQILDHDAPIYKGLRPYQQHGSVYGIIIPEHIDFGPVGTWHSEEIRAEGDHIKVTVDGKVLTDGNIRKACKGHNVAPDGGKNNPYTIDHQNHPGLFNKSGKISFCGHGEGLKFRNIRILDLSKK